MNITKKIQVDNNDQEYVLFRIDIYFTEYFQQQKLMKKFILTDTLFLKKRDKRHQKRLSCTFIRINTSKENYDEDYEVIRIQTFISNFNKSKIKELEDKIKN